MRPLICLIVMSLLCPPYRVLCLLVPSWLGPLSSAVPRCPCLERHHVRQVPATNHSWSHERVLCALPSRSPAAFLAALSMFSPALAPHWPVTVHILDRPSHRSQRQTASDMISMLWVFRTWGPLWKEPLPETFYFGAIMLYMHLAMVRRVRPAFPHCHSRVDQTSTRRNFLESKPFQASNVILRSSQCQNPRASFGLRSW